MVTATKSNTSHQTTYALASFPSIQELGNLAACSIARLAEMEPSQDKDGKRNFTPITYNLWP